MAKRIILSFVAGFVATLVFHQVALALLHAGGIAPSPAWRMTPVPPFGVPAVISLSFWGGVWGVIMIVLIDRLRGATYYVVAIVFGAVLPTLVAAFVVAPLKHLAIPHSGKMAITGFTVNAAWGLGTALLYRLTTRSSLPAADRSR